MPKLACWVIRGSLAALIALSVLIEGCFIPQIGREIVSVNPDAEPLFAPALVWAVLVIGCAQVVLLIGWKLTSLVAREQAFTRSALPWTQGMMMLAAVGLGLVVLAFITLSTIGYTPPLIMYGLVGMALFCAAFAFLAQTMSGSLRRLPHRSNGSWGSGKTIRRG